MSTSVPRHAYPVDNTAEGLAVLDETLSWVVGELEDPDDTGRSQALSVSVALAQSRCAIDPEASKFETWDAWVTAMQIGCALFDSAASAEGPVPCRIGGTGEVKYLPATGPTSYTHVGAWLTAWYLATICRENERLDRLAHVPVSFLRQSGAVFDEYVYDWVEALQSFWFQRPAEMWDKLVAAIKKTDPDTAPHIADKETLLKLLYPPLELFQLCNRGDAERFNSALFEFLTWHKQYWADGEERAQSSDGLVALGLLAIACMAYDNDLPVEVQSQYLPKHLLQRSWVGEFDT
ncbi:immunity 49 family protein [Streptomyces sp. NPDC006739]|uniref:immunity 49 family protein n=1 Tax=Streptomyces sp. NPDC006739 TaxID=3364763 RepID=UPI0036B3DC0B